MCRIDVPWHVIPVHSQVTVQDDDGDYVLNAKNSDVAYHITENHNKGITSQSAGKKWSFTEMIKMVVKNETGGTTTV